MPVILTLIVVICSSEKCSDPSAKTNAMVVGNAFFDGQELEFVCSKKDFVLYPPRSSKLRCQDGDWSGTIPSCKGIR